LPLPFTHIIFLLYLYWLHYIIYFHFAASHFLLLLQLFHYIIHYFITLSLHWPFIFIIDWHWYFSIFILFIYIYITTLFIISLILLVLHTYHYYYWYYTFSLRLFTHINISLLYISWHYCQRPLHYYFHWHYINFRHLLIIDYYYITLLSLFSLHINTLFISLFSIIDIIFRYWLLHYYY